MRKAGSAWAELEPVLDAATTAIEEHLAWLTERRDDATGNPRLGPELFARRLVLTLDTASTPDEVLVRAEAELVRIEEEIAEVAARLDVQAKYTVASSPCFSCTDLLRAAATGGLGVRRQ